MTAKQARTIAIAARSNIRRPPPSSGPNECERRSAQSPALQGRQRTSCGSEPRRRERRAGCRVRSEAPRRRERRAGVTGSSSARSRSAIWTRRPACGRAATRFRGVGPGNRLGERSRAVWSTERASRSRCFGDVNSADRHETRAVCSFGPDQDFPIRPEAQSDELVVGDKRARAAECKQRSTGSEARERLNQAGEVEDERHDGGARDDRTRAERTRQFEPTDSLPSTQVHVGDAKAGEADGRLRLCVAP